MSLDFNDPSVFVIPITTLIVILFSTFYASSLRRLSTNLDKFEFEDILKFTVHKWFYVTTLINSCIGAMCFSFPYQVGNDEVLAWIIFGCMGLFWILLNLRWAYLGYNSHVIIDSEALEMKYGKKVNRILFSEIRDVDAVSFYIWVSTDDLKPAMKIPMAFKGSHQILGILRSKISLNEF